MVNTLLVVPRPYSAGFLTGLAFVIALLGSASFARAGERGASRSAKALGDAYRALEAQDLTEAYAIAASIDRKRLENADYARYVLAQSASLLGRHKTALGHFRALAKQSGSRFREVAAWREADCLWELGRIKSAAKAYERLLAAATAPVRGKKARRRRNPVGDLGLARFRLAEAKARGKKKKTAIAAFREFLRTHPAHPLAPAAEDRLRSLGGDKAAHLDPGDRIARARRLTAAHLWHESIAELAMIGDDIGESLRRERDFWTGMTLFKMRRRYKDAGDILLRIYRDMGDRAAKTLFHGARALSRADFDAEAIIWYQRVVAEYPRSRWAREAQFLSGWLEFNMRDYKAAIPHLETMLDRYGKSRWAVSARWFLGLSHYMLGQYEESLPHFAKLAEQSGRLKGGKGRYWHARSLEKLGRKQKATSEYRALVGRYPFSWYAHLARARLAEHGIAIGPFGPEDGKSRKPPPIAAMVDRRLADDPLIRRADELMAAGLEVEAGFELRRGEKPFLKRHKRASALTMLMDRYRRGHNFNRPWMLAVVYGGRKALNATPEPGARTWWERAYPRGEARVWWEHAYPLAYRELIDRWRHLGRSPTYYLYSIMRKESGFNPHVLSYADAIGLLQMIPPTTRRVAKHLGMEYTSDLLYDPELNIKTGSWYIGRLLEKFKGQIPFGAGSFNSGPRPVMRWMDQFGHLPVDEFVEMVPYRQTREYMKKVTETYSRYLYLYERKVYEQPLVVDREYLKNDLTY